jgi:hypothetical protein
MDIVGKSGVGMSLNVKGLDELRKRFEATSKAMRETIEGHALATIGAVMQEAQRTVPVVTGELKSTAFIKSTKSGNGTASAKSGYTAPHALHVHEIQYSGYTTKGLPGAKNNGKGYKWLEKAGKKMQRNAYNLLRAGISQTLMNGKPVKWNVPALDRGGRAGFAARLGKSLVGVAHRLQGRAALGEHKISLKKPKAPRVTKVAAPKHHAPAMAEKVKNTQTNLSIDWIKKLMKKGGG